MLHPESLSAKAVFLDKDGTLVRDVPYNVDPDLIMFETGVFEGLRLLQRAGYKLAVISNQPGLAMGLFSQEQIENLVRYFETSFMVNGLELSGFYYCPHLPSVAESACFCRKPEPGLLFQAARELDIDLRRSWMIGDILNDVEAGNRAGCRTVLIDNGNETEWADGLHRTAMYKAPDFLSAANYVHANTLPNHA